jgi:hypothetical protein
MPEIGLPDARFLARLYFAERKHHVSTGTYEVVTRGTPMPAVLQAMGGFEVASVRHGLSHLIGTIPDQDRMRQLFELLRDLNIELVSINPVSNCDT